MEKKLLRTFLIALIGLVGFSSIALAQDIPEPTAQWNFNNANDLLAPDKGSLTMSPAKIGAKSISLSTLSEAGIVQTDGPTDDNKAIYVPAASALKVVRAEGAAASQSYTIMMDVKVSNAGPYDGLLQTDENNSNDGDLFIYNHKVGVGSIGGYFGNIDDNTWYRVVITYRDGMNIIYLNGKRLVAANPDNNDRYKIQPFGFYLFCDEDGEKTDSYVSSIAFWESPLSEIQINELGGVFPREITEIGTAEELVNFAKFVSEGNAEANAMLTADITLTEPWETAIGIDGKPYSGIFDGQGHKISGFNATSSGKFGLFGVTSGAFIKNLSVDGTLTVTGGTGSGIIGWASGTSVSNVHSTLAIAVTEGGTHHVAGVVGSAQGNNTISGCTFAGSLTVVTGNNDNFAGVVSYLGNDRVEYCANYGTITYADLGCCAGGIVAYINNTASYVRGCLNTGKVSCEVEGENPSYGSAIVGWLRSYDVKKVTGNCWLEGSGNGAGRNGSDVLKAVCFTADKLATGAVCYALNDDQEEIGWHQTLGTDEAPVLDDTHAQVYIVGRKHCNGDVYDDVTYTNTYSEIALDDHNVVDGFCDYCGLYFEDGLLPNADNYYEIANAKQLTWFEMKVNKGALDANAILTADIDFADLMPEGADPEETEVTWVPIGDWGNTRGTGSAAYKGHFNGQGHAIKNLHATAKQNFFGLFGVISTGALIENFNIYGTYSTPYQYLGGVAAYGRDDKLSIRNVHSYVTIKNTCVGGRQGGIMGGAHGTLTVIEGCTYSGTMGSNDNGGGGNYGGIVGYIQNANTVYVEITNCLFDGELVNTADAPGNCTFGGIVGYANSPYATIKNCLSIGRVESPKYAQFFGALNGPNSKIYNSFYQGDFVNGSSSGMKANPQEATLVTSDQLSSGEITWKLNEESFLDPVWHHIDDAAYPVPYGNLYGIVYETSNKGYEIIDPEDPASVAAFISDVISNETGYTEEIVAYQGLLDAYAVEIQKWVDIEDLEKFFTAYKAANEIKNDIKKSAAKYDTYKKACEDAVQYIEDNKLEGEWTDFLVTYLNPDEGQEPNNDYPNGSYNYIIENHLLNDEALEAEMAFVSQMLENAIAGGITAGTEITRLMVNPDFKNGYEGWNVEFEGGTSDVAGNTEIMPIPEAFNNKSFNASQTLNEVPNGIYMTAINGLFRSGSDVACKFYAGQLYLNGTYNYFMSPSEDYISLDDAEIDVNCLGKQGGDAEYMIEQDVVGYVPNSRNGCSVAFNAGRYQNFCATEVTDSTLTIGMRNLATGLASDWMPFGNVHVYYLGTEDEANEKLADVLNAFADRAQTIIDFEFDDNDAYTKYPNMSKGLKDQLADLVAAVPSAATGKEKMNLINSFSALFNEVHANRKAYIAMFDAAQKLYNLLTNLDDKGMVSEEVYNQWDYEISTAQTYYMEGTATTEEALVLADKLNNANLIELPIEDGVYQLATAKDLIIFAGLVNMGMNTSDAVLADDIDMTGYEWNEPIGFWGDKQIGYKGHFNGQGHSISNFICSSTQNFYGLFGVLSTNAIVENFSIYGMMDNPLNVQYMGVIGYARDENVTIRDIHSYMDLANAREGGRQGGILGCADNGTTNIIRCTYSGTFNSTDAGGGGNYGGIVGYANNNAAAVLNITSCLFDGQLINTAATPGNCTFGGMVGYCNSATTTIKDCLSIGTVQSPRNGQFFGALNGPNSKIYNSYYKGSYINGSGSGRVATPQEATEVSDTQLASGEVCYKLNGDQSVINWYQTIGDDNIPVLDKSHMIVVYDSNKGYRNATQDEVDGITNEELRVKNEEFAPAVYDLAGRKLNSQFIIHNSQLKNGIYILNGKKVIF